MTSERGGVESGDGDRDDATAGAEADGAFEVLCRLYGPQQPFFDKAWKLPDIERVR